MKININMHEATDGSRIDRHTEDDMDSELMDMGRDPKAPKYDDEIGGGGAVDVLETDEVIRVDKENWLGRMDRERPKRDSSL